MKKISLFAVFASLLAAGASYAAAACCGGASDKTAEASKATMSCCSGGAHAHGASQAHATMTAAPAGSASQGEASAESQELVKAYESLSNAIFDEKMAAVEKAADALQKVAREQNRPMVAAKAEQVAGAKDINAARKAFTQLSQATVAAVADQPGYYVMQCPMFENGQWLQSTAKIHNPYMGARMPACGMIQRQTGSES